MPWGSGPRGRSSVVATRTFRPGSSAPTRRPITRRSRGSADAIRRRWPRRSARSLRSAPGPGWCRSASSRWTEPRWRPTPQRRPRATTRRSARKSTGSSARRLTSTRPRTPSTGPREATSCRPSWPTVAHDLNGCAAAGRSSKPSTPRCRPPMTTTWRGARNGRPSTAACSAAASRFRRIPTG